MILCGEGHWFGDVGVQHLCCDLELTFDLTVVTLTLQILSGLYLGNSKA